MKAKVQKLALPKNRRILAVSDIHGNLPYLKGLLEKAQFSRGDVLIICGDFLEKGNESLKTLRYIMGLSEDYTVYPLLGNCDSWHLMLDVPGYGDAPQVRSYITNGGRNWGPGLLAQMCDEIGFTRGMDMDIDALKRELGANFGPEFDFLRSLPHIIDTEHYTFVHGGLPEGRLKDLDAVRCMKNDNFMNQGRKFDKWVTVGHWPVVLYGGDIVCANPIIDRESRIISIDGGCVLKDDGQLNALVIPFDGSEDFSHIAYDHFPVRRVKSAQKGSEKSAYFRYGDNEVKVLSRGGEFCRCRHVRTGYEMDILTKYLWGGGEVCRCNDCTDFILPLNAGDEVSVVEETGRGYLVKRDGTSGWYFGALTSG